MKPFPLANIFIYTALPCEAKPLIDFYRLKKDSLISSFAVYRNNNICLTVTGLGKIAMAAGVSYTQAIFPSESSPVLLNVGIAGHKEQPIGNVFLIDKISDYDTGRHFYPPLVFTPPCPTYNLLTASKPQLSYPPLQLCDMEASAFYEIATRFTTGELIQCLKIVSDNELSPAEMIQPMQVSELINDQLSIITAILKELSQLAELLKSPELSEFDHLLNRYHFTINEQIQLKKLLTRRRLLTEQSNLEFTVPLAKNGKEFLKLLDQQLNEIKFHL